LPSMKPLSGHVEKASHTEEPGCSLATPTTFYSRLEGSTDEEELISTNAFMSTTVPSTKLQTPTELARAEQDFLKDLVDFLEKNVLLILVITALVLLVFLMICGVLLMSHWRKVNSYYPASFPSKMYVDERDKTGGARSFNEVQGKAACEHESLPVDSHRQLQADIMRAAKSLRAASKSTDATEKDESYQQEADPASENISKSNCTILDQELSSVPEEKEPCELGDSGATSDPQLELHPGDEDSQEPAADRNLRPASLHIHNDSATLQLLAGEKTAF
uniref:Transmembrane protein 119b n=1 Tax=Oryzias latipes TaxID=8090 RepID=A0A3P9H6Y7_ORYLA